MAGRSLKIKIDRIAPEGEGIGKPEGSDKVVFVPHALPGETVEADIREEKSRYLRANLLKVVAPAGGRVDPPCPHHFRPGMSVYCGGCNWQHAGYPEQLKLKKAIVLDCLKRIAKLECLVHDTLASPQPWRYRNKVQIPFQPVPHPALSQGERGAEISTSPLRGEGGVRGFAAGFFVPGSHRVVEFEDCLVQPELSVGIFSTVKKLAQKYHWPPYDEQQGRGWLRHLYLRTNSEGKALVVLVTRTPDFPTQAEAIAELSAAHPEIISVWQNVQAEKTAVILGPKWRKLAGQDRLLEKIGDFTLEFSPGAFLQVNTPAAEVLYRTAEEFLFADRFKPELVLDLYSGIGAIAFWIARRAGRVIGIEEVPQAVDDAYQNARRLNIRNVNFIKGKAEFALRRMRGLDAHRPWAAVIDPPRSGCDAEVLRFLAHRKIERIVYVSCNPATFARDAERLAGMGYALKKVQPVDLFPQTSHVELVAQLDLGQKALTKKPL